MNCVTHHEACDCRQAAMVERLKRHAEERDHYRDEVAKLNLQNRELQNRVEMLKLSLESVLKRELGLDFQTYLESKAALPLTRVLIDEVIAKLPDFTDKRKEL